MEQRSMNKVTDKELHLMTVPAVSMEQHQVQLKQALLAASYPANKTAKTRWSNLMRYTKKPKFIVSGLTMAFAAVAIVAFGTFTSLGSVSAAELTQQSLDKVSQLSPTAQKALDERVNGDPKAELRAARSAKDLEILTYDQFKNLSLGGPNQPTLRVAGYKGTQSLTACGWVLFVLADFIEAMIFFRSSSNMAADFLKKSDRISNCWRL
jgi:hypothetical protein